MTLLMDSSYPAMDSPPTTPSGSDMVLPYLEICGGSYHIQSTGSLLSVKLQHHYSDMSNPNRPPNGSRLQGYGLRLHLTGQLLNTTQECVLWMEY